MITGIIVALPEELGTLVSGKVEKGHYAPLTNDILVAHGGAGAENARAAAELLIDRGANKLISWGCAAALSAELMPGSLVIADVVKADDQPAIDCDRDWIDHVRSIIGSELSINIGSLTTSATLVADRNKKRTIYEKTGSLALDMESYAIAETATKAGLPFLAIRTIADPVSMSLPQAVSHALNAEGEVELPKLIGYVLTHPSEIPSLITLGRHFNAAKKTLRSIAKYLGKITEFSQLQTD
ncbi:phosphorylase [Methylomarinum sp. Ch1-1]|uniref:Phosphorylase n=1 Tax=Methylomarinum roseum TaxID=3067653 RepID=A0AAU7NTE1_9GAMM|nr:phosphorylase [Methylomarinum sp. Ch1-1]MDP4520122.1 phosphorylase [Methylomarinum sp. Ch1-1]